MFHQRSMLTGVLVVAALSVSIPGCSSKSSSSDSSDSGCEDCGEAPASETDCDDGVDDDMDGDFDCDDSDCADDAGCGADCGNGTVDSGEDCEGSDLNGATCTSLGYDSGSLACTSSCDYDTSACCTDESYHQCPTEGTGYDVYWYDSCGNQGSVKESCSSDERCVNTSATEASCDSTTATEANCDDGIDDDKDGDIDCDDTDCADDPVCDDGECMETDYWSPDSMTSSDTDSIYKETLEVEWRDAGSGGDIEFRVCKPAGAFTNDIFVTFEEWVKYSGYGMIDSAVGAAGSSCTSWETLSTSSWSEGDGFGGDMRIVSPDYCESDWSWTCSGSGSCGSCWFISSSIMTRTCL